MLSMEKIAILVIVIVVCGNMVTPASAACFDRFQSNATTDTAGERVSKFFEALGCSIQNGAGRIKDRVETGFNYIKNKITPDENNQTLSVNETTLSPLDEEQAEKWKQFILPQVSSQQISEVSLINALIAPEFCPQGQVRINGQCRDAAS